MEHTNLIFTEEQQYSLEGFRVLAEKYHASQAQLQAARERIEVLSHQRDIFEHDRNRYAERTADLEIEVAAAEKKQMERWAAFVIKWCSEQTSAWRSDQLADAMIDALSTSAPDTK